MNDYAYLTFYTAIRVVLCMGGPVTYTDYPNSPGQIVKTLFKFQNGWIIGFGTNQPNTAPEVSLYKVTINSPFTFFKSFKLTQEYS